MDPPSRGPSFREGLEGALLGTFAGDAIGRRFEGAGPVDADGARERLERALEGELVYTDDTQLAIALATHLLEAADVDPPRLVAIILDHYEPHRGYGAGMRQVVAAWRRGAPLDAAARAAFADGSLGNGAAMRVAPLGVWLARDQERLDDAVERASWPTHAHPVGIDGARVQARAAAVAYLRGRFGPDELEEVAASASTDELRQPLRRAHRLVVDAATAADAVQELGNGVVAPRSVPTALWAAAAASGPEDAITAALAVGGDTDTIAAMAGAVQGAAHGPRAIPERWQDRMEDGPRGVGHVRELARRLGAAAATADGRQP